MRTRGEPKAPELDPEQQRVMGGEIESEEVEKQSLENGESSQESVQVKDEFAYLDDIGKEDSDLNSGEAEHEALVSVLDELEIDESSAERDEEDTIDDVLDSTDAEVLLSTEEGGDESDVIRPGQKAGYQLSDSIMGLMQETAQQRAKSEAEKKLEDEKRAAADQKGVSAGRALLGATESLISGVSNMLGSITGEPHAEKIKRKLHEENMSRCLTGVNDVAALSEHFSEIGAFEAVNREFAKHGLSYDAAEKVTESFLSDFADKSPDSKELLYSMRKGVDTFEDRLTTFMRALDNTEASRRKLEEMIEKMERLESILPEWMVINGTPLKEMVSKMIEAAKQFMQIKFGGQKAEMAQG